MQSKNTHIKTVQKETVIVIQWQNIKAIFSFFESLKLFTILTHIQPLTILLLIKSWYWIIIIVLYFPAFNIL